MSLFGYYGAHSADLNREELKRYGHKQPGSTPMPPGAEAEGSPNGCWAPQVFRTGGLIIALDGKPLWRPTDGTPNWAKANVESLGEQYRQVGEKMLSRLGGNFAVVIIDQEAQRVLLAVDPMGIERLAYTLQDGGIIFGSSAEAVARSPGRNATLRNQSIYDYLLMHMVPAPHTIFAGVDKLPAGACGIYERGHLNLQRYWQPRFEETLSAPIQSLHKDLYATLRHAVKACEPDARSGAFLSGGLDSSTVAGMLSLEGTPPAKTFSIGFGYPDYDELPYARLANRHFGCVGHEHVVNGQEIADSFPLIAAAYDEPFGNSSALPAYYCALLAKKHGVDHLLAGDGGDELFAGNSRYAEQQVFAHYQRLPKFLRTHLLEPVVANWPASLMLWPVRKARGYIEKANIPLPARLETWNIVHRMGSQSILHPDFLAMIDVDAPFADMQSTWDATPGNNQLRHMLYYDWQYTLANNDLRKVETMCRLAGVNVSYPMLHPAVIDLSTRIPANVMMPGNQLRHFYKQAMNGFLPNDIINKKKHGFGLPFGLWLNESANLRDLIYGNLTSLRQRNVIRPEFLDKLLQLHGQEDARYYGVFVWVMAMLEQWFQKHQVAP